MNYVKLWVILTGVFGLLTEVQNGTQILIAIVLMYIIWRVRSSAAHKAAIEQMKLRRYNKRLEYRAARRRYQRVRIQGYVSMVELAKSSFPNHPVESRPRITLAEILSGR